MGTLFVDKLDPQSGTSLELGSSGDTVSVNTGATTNLAGNVTLGANGKTITVPSGCTITNSGTATGFGEDNAPYFFARGSASTQTISHGTMTTVEYNNESLDSDNGYNTSTYKYTIPSGKAGLWFFSAAMYMSSLGDGQQYDLYIYKDSVNLAGYRTKPGGSMNPFGNIHTISNFAVGDSIYIQVFQNSGSNKDIVPNSDASHFAGFRIKANV